MKRNYTFDSSINQSNWTFPKIGILACRWLPTSSAQTGRGKAILTFYTQIQRNILIRLSRCVKIVRMPCRVISNLYAPQNQPSLEFALTLRHFLHKTVPSSPPQQGVGIKSRLYNIFVMNIMEIASFGGNLSKTVDTKEKLGNLAKNMKTMTDL